MARHWECSFRERLARDETHCLGSGVLRRNRRGLRRKTARSSLGNVDQRLPKGYAHFVFDPYAAVSGKRLEHRAIEGLFYTNGVCRHHVLFRMSTYAVRPATRA
jgi:hypothetical protein